MSTRFSLRQTVSGLEDGIIVLSGPALAISGIIAGVDLVTGGNILKSRPEFTLAWAITLLLSLDFQVLCLGVRSHRVYASTKPGEQKALEILIAFVIAAAISFVSIQMQSIIARVNAEGIAIDQAAIQLGINTVWLIWERSTLVLVLIFMSGWLRETDHQVDNMPAQPSAPAPATIVNEAITDAPALAEVPEYAQSLATSRFASKEQEIARALEGNPNLTADEIAVLVKCTPRTAEKWATRWKERQS